MSPEEVGLLIESAILPFHRVILMTLYATGVRRAELANLRVSDIDSKRMVIQNPGGKGLKDREVMLSKVLIEALREHWKRYQPKEWLFPGGNDIHPQNRSHLKSHGRHVSKRPNDAAWKRRSIRMCFAIALQLTCSTPVRICAPFSYCWGTAALNKRRAIFTYRNGI